MFSKEKFLISSSLYETKASESILLTVYTYEYIINSRHLTLAKSYSRLPSYVPICERFMANGTLEGPLACMKTQMALQHPRPIEALAAIRTIMHRFISLPGLSVLLNGRLILGGVDRLVLLFRHQIQSLRKRLCFGAVDHDFLIYRPVELPWIHHLRRIYRFFRIRGGSRRVVEQYRGHFSRVDRIHDVDRRSILTNICKISTRCIRVRVKRSIIDFMEAVPSYNGKS